MTIRKIVKVIGVLIIILIISSCTGGMSYSIHYSISGTGIASIEKLSYFNDKGDLIIESNVQLPFEKRYENIYIEGNSSSMTGYLKAEVSPIYVVNDCMVSTCIVVTGGDDEVNIKNDVVKVNTGEQISLEQKVINHYFYIW